MVTHLAGSQKIIAHQSVNIRRNPRSLGLLEQLSTLQRNHHRGVTGLLQRHSHIQKRPRGRGRCHFRRKQQHPTIPVGTIPRSIHLAAPVAEIAPVVPVHTEHPAHQILPSEFTHIFRLRIKPDEILKHHPCRTVAYPAVTKSLLNLPVSNNLHILGKITLKRTRQLTFRHIGFTFRLRFSQRSLPVRNPGVKKFPCLAIAVIKHMQLLTHQNGENRHMKPCGINCRISPHEINRIPQICGAYHIVPEAICLTVGLFLPKTVPWPAQTPEPVAKNPEQCLWNILDYRPVAHLGIRRHCRHIQVGRHLLVKPAGIENTPPPRPVPGFQRVGVNAECHIRHQQDAVGQRLRQDSE